MFSQSQYDAWLIELSEFFIKKHGFQMVAMPKEQKEIWLCNVENKETPILMLSAQSTDALNQAAIMEHRMALAKVFHVDHVGLNISVNQESILTDEHTVVLAPGSHSVSSLIDSFNDIKMVLNESANPERALKKAYMSLGRTAMKLQKKARRRALKVSTVVAVITIVIFLMSLYLQFQKGVSLEVAAIMLGAYYKPLISYGGEWFRLLTSGFLHVDYFHLLINLLALKNLATLAEPLLGTKKYITVLLLGIIFGNAFVFVRGEAVIGLGLSGGLFALLGVVLVYMFETGAIKNPRVRQQMISILLINLMIGFFPGISMMAHIGGFQLGLFMGVIFSKKTEWAEIRKGAKIILSIFSVAMIVAMIYKMPTTSDDIFALQIAKTYSQLGFKSYASRILRVLF